MISSLTFYWRLSRLRAAQRRTEKAYRAARAKAIKENRQLDLSALRAKEIYEAQWSEEEIADLRTRHLYRMAGRYDVDAWQEADWWEESSIVGGQLLTAKGFRSINAELRKEKNERWAFFEMRLKVVSLLLAAVTGAAGALTGLVAIVKN